MVSESEDVADILNLIEDYNSADDGMVDLHINEQYNKFIKKYFNSGSYYNRFFVAAGKR